MQYQTESINLTQNISNPEICTTQKDSPYGK